MTKYLTTAAWAALVLGGVAVADTPPAESAEVATEEAAAEVATEAPTTIYRYGDEAEAAAETETVGTVANVTVEGEVEAAEATSEDAAEEPALEAEESEEAAPEAE